jgi:hypothetical protein
VEDVEQIKQVAVKFYEKLLGTNQMQFTKEKADRIILATIPSNKVAILEREVTSEEIRDTLFHMPINKAHGPDGYTVEFFKDSWLVVGEGVVATIKRFFCL